MQSAQLRQQIAEQFGKPYETLCAQNYLDAEVETSAIGPQRIYQVADLMRRQVLYREDRFESKYGNSCITLVRASYIYILAIYIRNIIQQQQQQQRNNTIHTTRDLTTQEQSTLNALYRTVLQLWHIEPASESITLSVALIRNQDLITTLLCSICIAQQDNLSTTTSSLFGGPSFRDEISGLDVLANTASNIDILQSHVGDTNINIQESIFQNATFSGSTEEILYCKAGDARQPRPTQLSVEWVPSTHRAHWILEQFLRFWDQQYLRRSDLDPGTTINHHVGVLNPRNADNMLRAWNQYNYPRGVSPRDKGLIQSDSALYSDPQRSIRVNVYGGQDLNFASPIGHLSTRFELAPRVFNLSDHYPINTNLLSQSDSFLTDNVWPIYLNKAPNQCPVMDPTLPMYYQYTLKNVPGKIAPEILLFRASKTLSGQHNTETLKYIESNIPGTRFDSGNSIFSDQIYSQLHYNPVWIDGPEFNNLKPVIIGDVLGEYYGIIPRSTPFDSSVSTSDYFVPFIHANEMLHVLMKDMRVDDTQNHNTMSQPQFVPFFSDIRYFSIQSLTTTMNRDNLPSNYPVYLEYFSIQFPILTVNVTNRVEQLLFRDTFIKTQISQSGNQVGHLIEDDQVDEMITLSNQDIPLPYSNPELETFQYIQSSGGGGDIQSRLNLRGVNDTRRDQYLSKIDKKIVLSMPIDSRVILHHKTSLQLFNTLLERFPGSVCSNDDNANNMSDIGISQITTTEHVLGLLWRVIYDRLFEYYSDFRDEDSFQNITTTTTTQNTTLSLVRGDIVRPIPITPTLQESSRYNVDIFFETLLTYIQSLDFESASTLMMDNLFTIFLSQNQSLSTLLSVDQLFTPALKIEIGFSISPFVFYVNPKRVEQEILQKTHHLYRFAYMLNRTLFEQVFPDILEEVVEDNDAASQHFAYMTQVKRVLGANDVLDIDRQLQHLNVAIHNEIYASGPIDVQMRYSEMMRSLAQRRELMSAMLIQQVSMLHNNSINRFYWPCVNIQHLVGSKTLNTTQAAVRVIDILLSDMKT